MAKSLNDPRYRAMIKQLVALRHAADLTQRDVAERLAEPRSFVSKIEQCQQRLDPVQLVDWLRAVGADERKFLVDMLKDIPAVKRKR